MKVKSYYSVNLNAYQAGIEIGEELSNIHPEVVFLFSSIHYNGSSELIEGIYDSIGITNLILIGNTGDGFYEQNKVASIGVSALAINSEGKVKWKISYRTGIDLKPYECTKQCLDELKNSNKNSNSKLYFTSLNFSTDSSEIIKAFKENTDGQVVGGLASDDYKLQKSFIYANKKVLTNSIAVLSIDGSIEFDIKLAHNMHPIGKTGIITKSSGTFIDTIDNISAMDYISKELGKPLDTIDEGITTLKITSDSKNNDIRVRSIFTSNNSSIKLAGGIKQGNRAQICIASPEKIIKDVSVIAKSSRKLHFTPTAALIVSCAGRKKVLANNIKDEVNEITKNIPSIKAIVGYPSLGEIGPVRNNKGYSQTLFHNMTFILLLIGENTKQT